MQEDFLQYLWQFQQFDHQGLSTTDGQALQVIQTGIHNPDAGPDFTAARLRIGGIEWSGQVEVHLCSADWDQHRHHQDPAYDTVVLHVVWKHNKSVYRLDGSLLPTLELDGRVRPSLIDTYKTLVGQPQPILCQPFLSQIAHIYLIEALDRALVNRLESKARQVLDLWEDNGHDWEETAYQVLARNFGFKVNNDPFLKTAQELPLKVMHKHADQLLQLEALLLGQAGFLEIPEDAYTTVLAKEYGFLRHKYQLEIPMKVSQWKFARLRPANSPTLRLAQFAAFLHQNPSVFSALVDWEHPDILTKSFELSVSSYWKQHYHPGKPSKAPVPGFGKSSLENLMANTVVPLLVAVSMVRDQPLYKQKAISVLERLPAEDNNILREWEAAGIKARNAFDSQALIELYNHSCTPRKCLSCRIGNAVLGKAGI
jgi:hypothetical protein